MNEWYKKIELDYKNCKKLIMLMTNLTLYIQIIINLAKIDNLKPSNQFIL